jgi:CBS domain-containing protein
LVLSPILLAQEHISADFPDYPVSGHAPDTAKPRLLALTGHERVKVAVTHNKAFPSALTKINAAKGALRKFITRGRRRLSNGSQGAFKLKYDLACSVEGRPHRGRMPMTVKAILSRKGNEVVTIPPTATLFDAVKILDTHRIGAVVIAGADECMEGILSERDVVRTLAHNIRTAGRCQLCDEPVEKVMTREVATCKYSDTVYDLMERMTTGKFRHVPVIEDGRLAGIISIGDVVKHRLAEMASESNALREYIATA